MPTIFTSADRECRQIVSDLIAEHYPDLADAKVEIGLWFAFAARNNEEEPPPALKLHGYPCAALVKINSYKARRDGAPDATIEIDGEGWKDWNERRRTATLHHELHHLLVQRDDEEGVKSDDLGRPKLKMRLHDVQVGGFEEIAKRYKDDAFEVELIRDGVQRLLPWGDDMGGFTDAEARRAAANGAMEASK